MKARTVFFMLLSAVLFSSLQRQASAATIVSSVGGSFQFWHLGNTGNAGPDGVFTVAIPFPGPHTNSINGMPGSFPTFFDPLTFFKAEVQSGPLFMSGFATFVAATPAFSKGKYIGDLNGSGDPTDGVAGFALSNLVLRVQEGGGYPLNIFGNEFNFANTSSNYDFTPLNTIAITLKAATVFLGDAAETIRAGGDIDFGSNSSGVFGQSRSLVAPPPPSPPPPPPALPPSLRPPLQTPQPPFDSTVPEPSTFIMASLLGIVGTIARKRRAKCSVRNVGVSNA